MCGAIILLLLALEQPADHAAEGLKALEAQDYAAAEQHLSRAVEADPSDFTARFNLALTQSLLGKRRDAIEGYRKVLSLKPGLYEAELNLGILLVLDKQSGEAVTLLESACRQKPGEFKPHFWLAEALLSTGKTSSATEHFERALELDPKNAGAWLGLARSQIRQGKLEEAEASIIKALDLEPDSRQALLELAAAYEQAGRLDKALDLYTQFPDHAAALERRALLLIKTGQSEQALWPLERLLAGEPDNAGLRLTYGRVLRDLKRYREAAAQFSFTVRLQPDLAEGWGELASVSVLLEDYAAALQALDRLKDLGAEKPGHLYLRAIMLDKMRQLKPALEYYEKFLEASRGASPNEEFLARQRARIIKKEMR